MRRAPFALILLVAMVATSCRVLLVPDPPGRAAPTASCRVVPAAAPGLLPRLRVTTQFAPGSFTNLIANAEHARRTGTPFNTAGITMADFANSFSALRQLRRHVRLRPHVPDEPLVRLPRPAPGRRARRDRGALQELQVLVHRPAAGGHHRPAVLLVREPPRCCTTPTSTSPARRSRTTSFSQRRQHRRMAPATAPTGSSTSGSPRRRGSASPSGTPTSTTRRRSTRCSRSSSGSNDPVLSRRASMVLDLLLLRHRAPHPEGQRRRDARPLVHEGQERRRPTRTSSTCRSCSSTTRSLGYNSTGDPGATLHGPRPSGTGCPR